MHPHDDSITAAQADVYLRADVDGPADAEAAELRRELNQLATCAMQPLPDRDERLAIRQTQALVRNWVNRPVVAGRIGPGDTAGGSALGRWVRWPLAAAALLVAGLVTLTFLANSGSATDPGLAVNGTDTSGLGTEIDGRRPPRPDDHVDRFDELFDSPALSDRQDELSAALAWIDIDSPIYEEEAVFELIDWSDEGSL